MIQLLRLQTSAADSEEISIKALTSGRRVHASLVPPPPASSCLSLFFYEGKRTKGLASSWLRTRRSTKGGVLGQMCWQGFRTHTSVILAAFLRKEGIKNE